MEKYKRENPDATDADIDIKSILSLSKNARALSGGARTLVQQVPTPQHDLAAMRVQQALLRVQETRTQLAVAERDARMAAAHAGTDASHAEVRAALLLNPTNYAVAFGGLLLLVAIYFTRILMEKLHITRSRLG